MPRLPAPWRKVQRDLLYDRLRTLLAVASIAIGVSAVGMVSGASRILTTTLDGAYRQNHAASATFSVGSLPVGQLAGVEAVPGVAAAAGRHSAAVRVHSAGAWRNLTLTALPDYGRIEIDRFYPQAGAWPPPPGQVLLERSTLAFLGARIGDSAEVETADGRRLSLRVAGTVHDLNYPAAKAAGLLNGYLDWSTLGLIGERADFNVVAITVQPGCRTLSQVAAVAAAVRAELAAGGHPVISDQVPIPGQFWADDQINATVLLLDVMAAVSFLMSAFLVSNIVAALVTRQVREIGVMKSVGATPVAVGSIYLASVAAYALLALLIAIPAGVVGALGIVSSTRDVLNFDPPGIMLFPDVLALQVAAGLVVALGAAAVPVLRAVALTVREAISTAGPGSGGGGRGLAALLPRASTPVRLAAANAFRRRGRAALTLLALVLAGAAFSAVISVRASVDQTLNDAVGTRGYDVQLTLAQPMPAGAARALAGSVDGVTAVETWTVAPAIRLRPDGSQSDSLQLVAPPSGSTLIHPYLLSGHWLTGAPHELVLNSDVLRSEADLGPGGDPVLEIAGRQSGWHVVGVVRGALTGPVAYAQQSDLDAVLGSAGSTSTVVVIGSRHDAASESALGHVLDERFKSAGDAVTGVDTTAQWRDFLSADYGIATSFLLGMAVMLAAVGGLSLAGMLSVSVLERSRELGILRAIGAGDWAVRGLVAAEAMAVAAIAWLLAAPVSPFAARLLSDAFGLAFLHYTLSFVFAWIGLGLWACLVLVLAIVSSLLPAWNASRLTIREVLAFE